jgi:hypothetical protein
MPSEDLVINMRANDQLSVTLKKVGDAAEAAGSSVKKLTAGDVANFGASMLHGATSLATGLYGLAKASSDVVEQQNFVQQVFKTAAPNIEKFAKTAATSVGLSEAAALNAAASLGIFGRAVGMTGTDLASFSTSLVQLAGDMASVKNTSVETAVTAIGAAFRGQYRPIKQFGVVLNESVLQARAFEMGIYDGTGKLTQQQKVLATQAELYSQLDFAVGDFARTQDTLANQTRIAEANFTNLKANLGDTLRPAFIEVTHVANQAMEAFMKMPEPVKAAATNIALMGTAMLGVGGAVLYTVGKIGGMINTFRDLREKMQGIQAEGTGTQKALLGLGKVAAGLGVAVIGTQIVFDSINQITGSAQKASKAVQELNVAVAKGSDAKAWSAFLDIAKQKDDALTFGHLITDIGKKIQLFGSDTKRPIEDLDAAFKSLLDQNPDQAAKVLDIVEQQSKGVNKNSQQYKDNMMLLERWRKQLDLNVQSLQATGDATNLSNQTLTDHGDAALLAAAGDEEAQKAAQDLADYMEKLAGAIVNTDKQFHTAAQTADAFKDSIDIATGVDDATNSIVGYKDAIAKMGEGWKDSKGNIEKGALSLDINTQAGRDNIKAIDDVSNAMNQHLLVAYKDSNGDINAVTQAQAAMVDEFDNMLRAAGASESQIADFNKTLNETPEDVTIAMHLEGQEIAMKKLDTLNIEFDKLPDDISTQITAEMDEGDFVSAYQLASNFVNNRPLSFGMEADDPTTSIVEGLGTAQSVANKNPVSISTDVKTPSPWDAIGSLQGMLNANKPTTEIDVKPGDIKTPQGKNQDYAKTNQPTTEIETKPGDYQGPWKQIDAFTQSHHPVTFIDVKPGDWYSAWVFIALFYASRPAQMAVNVEIGDMTSAWGGIRIWYVAHPVSVTVNVATGDIGTAWSQIQTYFNQHPITVRVNTTQGTVSAPALPPGGVGGLAARPSAAEANAGAMSAMGLTAVGDTLLAAPAPVTAGRAAPTSTPNIINLNVNMPQGTNEAKVVDLLKRYQRANGSRPLTRN